MKFTEITEDVVARTQSHKNGTYVCFNVSDESAKELNEWCQEHDIHVSSPSEFHCTLIYSKTPIKEFSKFHGLKILVESKIKGWELFGEDENILVLSIESDDLTKINDLMIKCGATSDYDTYKPHVTICTEHEGEIPSEIPDFPITFKNVHVSGLE